MALAKKKELPIKVPKAPDPYQLSRMTKARAQLVMRQPFFGTLALGMKLVEDPTFSTGWTNGKVIAYNPTWVGGLRQSQVVGFAAHEVLHPAFLHHLRRGGRNKRKWNVACDYAINQILVDAGFDLPDNGYVDAKYKDLSAETIYNMLPDDIGKGRGPRGWDTDDPDPGQCGGVVDFDEAGDSVAETAEEHNWKVQVAAAAHAARQQGKLPASLERLVAEILKVTTPWREILRRFITDKSADDFSWSKGNRRYLSQGLYLPTAWSESMGEIVVAVDTSGSISIAELTHFFGEINKIREDTAPRQTHVIYCDAEVNAVEVYGPEDMIEPHPTGGGGTDFCPVFDYVAEKDISPKCLIYLTDMYGSFPTHAPEYPVLWATFTDWSQHPAPWGEHVEIDRAEMMT